MIDKILLTEENYKKIYDNQTNLKICQLLTNVLVLTPHRMANQKAQADDDVNGQNDEIAYLREEVNVRAITAIYCFF